MRVAIVSLFILALAVSTGVAYADPAAPMEEKPWSYDYGFVRADIPEVEPNNACPGQPMACGDRIIPAAIDVGGDVDYYEFAVTALPTTVTIGTDSYNGSTTDTYLELYGPDCSQPRLTYDDDGGPGAFSLINNFSIPAVGLYHIKVRHYSTSGVGAYQMFLNCTVPPPPPENDLCDGAIEIFRCQTGSIAGDLFYAANDYDPGVPGPSCTGYAAAGKDLVYKVYLEAGDLLNLVYTTPSHDGSMYVVTDCANVSASCVIGEDDPEPETINWAATAAGWYYIICDAYGTAAGSAFTLDWAITCPPPPDEGACCFADGSCQILTAELCAAAQGEWYGPDFVCDPNPCPPPTPVEESTWGQIKHQYR